MARRAETTVGWSLSWLPCVALKKQEDDIRKQCNRKCSKQNQCIEFVFQQHYGIDPFSWRERTVFQKKKKKDVKEVIWTLQAIVKREQSDEIRAMYGCGPYRLSNAYKAFEVEAVKWHAVETKNKMKHVANFRKY